MSRFLYRQQVSLIVLVTFCFSIFTTGFVLPHSASAYDVSGDHGSTTPKGNDPNNPNPANKPGQTGAAEPVNIANGNFYYEHRDTYISGRMPLEVTRQYNSQDMREGPFGYGWTFNYDFFLMPYSHQESGTIAMPDGWKLFGLKPGVRLDFKIAQDLQTVIPPKGYHISLQPSSDGATVRKKDGKTYRFDNSGRLTTISDRNGNKILFTYDNAGRLITVSDEYGRRLNFEYGVNNKITSITDPAGRVFNYHYDSNNNLVTYTNPAGYSTRYSYDHQHRLISITDAKGVTYLSNTYDSKNRVTEQVYNGNSFIFEYHPDQKYTKMRDRRGFWTTYYYNDNGNVEKKIDPLGNTTLTSWDENINPVTFTDSKGNVTQNEYDKNGNLVSVTDPLGNITRFTYELQYNRVKTITDALGNVTTYDYDERGNLVKVTDASGNITTFTYNEKGDLLTITDAFGNTTSFLYDEYGRLVSKTDPLGYSAAFEYDAVGNITSFTDQAGHVTLFSYDVSGHQTSVTNALGNITSYAYDENGNRITLTDAADHVTEFHYDDYNQLVKRTDALGNNATFTYDENGNRISETDPLGNVTTYQYDALDRIVQVTDARGVSTHFEYDENGNLISITDGNGNQTSYQYDALNRKIKITYANGSTEIFRYDAVGNITEKINRRADKIRYQYDPLHNLIKKIYPDSTEVTFSYDALGRLTSLSQPGWNISYTYDATGHIIDENQNGNVVSYEYDAVGNRSKLIYPDNSWLTYAYDELNRPNQIKNQTGIVVVSYAYDSLGRRTGVDYPNGTGTTFGYDALNRVTSVNNSIVSPASLISRFTYGYNSGGNRKYVVYGHRDNHGDVYTYDAIYQLTNVKYGVADPAAESQSPGSSSFERQVTYNFDNVWNRTFVTHADNSTVTYSSNSVNQYTAIDGSVLSYDSSGNLVSDGINTYKYDSENRLIHVITPDNDITYKYDPLGRRVEKDVSGHVVKFFYDGPRVIMETDQSGEVQAKYVYGAGIDEVVSMTRAYHDYYYHFDGLGSVSDITDANGTTVESYQYDVYGRATILDAYGHQIVESSVGNPYMFTGRRYDADSGLYYYRARYYHPRLGRFSQVDPIGYAGGMNLYAYVGNNPVENTDPFGLWYIDINVSIGWWLGGTGGIIISPEGIFPYAGLGIVSPPGGVGVTWSPSDPTPGWNVGLQGGYWGGGQVGYSFGENGGPFWELGFVTPGFSLTGYYVWAPWKWPWKRDEEKDSCK